MVVLLAMNELLTRKLAVSGVSLTFKGRRSKCLIKMGSGAVAGDPKVDVASAEWGVRGFRRITIKIVGNGGRRSSSRCFLVP